MSSSNEGIYLLKELTGEYTNDPFYERIIKKRDEFRNFEVENGLVYLKEKETKVLCIPKVIIRGRSAREIVIRKHILCLLTLEPVRRLITLGIKFGGKIWFLRPSLSVKLVSFVNEASLAIRSLMGC